MFLSQPHVAFSPCEVDIRQTWNDVVDGVDLAALQLEDMIEERARFIAPSEHHQSLPAHRGQPDLDIEAQRLPIEFYDFGRTLRCFDVHLERFGHPP